MLYAGATTSRPLWLASGDDWLLPSTVRRPVVTAPSGAILRPEVGPVAAALTLEETGFYTLHDNDPTGDPVAVLASNPPASESDLTPMAPSEMLVGVGEDSVSASVMTAATLADAERRQQIWRALLLLAVLAMIGETVMASRGWRGSAAKIVGTAPDGGVA